MPEKEKIKLQTGKNYEVLDMSLAEQGRRNIEWAELQMGALLKVKERFEKEKPLKGIRVGMALHVTKETAALVRTLVAGGAEVSITGCNPLSTQDDAAAALAEEGINVYAYKGETTEDYYRFINKVIEFKPHVTIDDGCDLVSEIHKKHSHLIKDIICGCEETTTGIIRLEAMEKDNALKYPMIAVNESDTKHLMDNYHGTGQSTIDGILRASNILFAGKTVVVSGYGNCGKGVSMKCRGINSNVVVTEVKPFRALQAHMDGFKIMKMEDAVKIGDVFVSVTGNKHVISLDHMKNMKDGAVVSNSGHFDNEIDMQGLEKAASRKRTIRPLFDEYLLDGKRIFVAGEGRLVNLSCAEGHPSTVMAMSFCNQALAVEWGIKNKGKLKPGLHNLPPEIDEHISSLQLDAMGVKHDKLTKEQKKYLESWEEGT